MSTNDPIRKAAGDLIAKLEAVHKDEHYLAVWQLADVHLGKYAGPFYDSELAALKKELVLDAVHAQGVEQAPSRTCKSSAQTAIV